MEGISFQSEFCKALVSHFDGRVVMLRVESRFHNQAAARGGARDQADDGLAADRRFASLVLRDETEQAMLDLVPFACARRKMADHELQLVSQFLQRHFPESRARTVAAAAVGRDQHLLRLREWFLAHLPPPTPNAVDGTLRCVVVDSHADPTLVVQHAVHPIGNNAAKGSKPFLNG